MAQNVSFQKLVSTGVVQITYATQDNWVFNFRIAWIKFLFMYFVCHGVKNFLPERILFCKI